MSTRHLIAWGVIFLAVAVFALLALRAWRRRRRPSRDHLRVDLFTDEAGDPTARRP